MTAQETLNRRARALVLEARAKDARRKATAARARADMAHTRFEYEDAFVEADEYTAAADNYDRERRELEDVGTSGPITVLTILPEAYVPGSLTGYAQYGATPGAWAHEPTSDGSPLCESGSVASGGSKTFCTCDRCF